MNTNFNKMFTGLGYKLVGCYPGTKYVYQRSVESTGMTEHEIIAIYQNKAPNLGLVHKTYMSMTYPRNKLIEHRPAAFNISEIEALAEMVKELDILETEENLLNLDEKKYEI